MQVQTEKLVANAIAEGDREAREIEAETQRLVAQIERKIADFEAKQNILNGQAEADAQQKQEEAQAEKFQLAVDAFGTPQAFNRWQFATELPENIDLKLFYAGEGTLWTDLKSITPTLPIAQP